MSEFTDHQELVGKRVRHNCGDPNCPLIGTVTQVVRAPDTSLRGEYSEYWAVVTWDGHVDVPHGHVMPVAVSKVKLIEDENIIDSRWEQWKKSGLY